MKTRYLIFTLLTGVFVLASCKKQLDVKPSKTLAVPQTLQDLQAILNNTNVITPAWPYSVQSASDDGYVTSDDWNASETTERNTYIWESEVFNDYNQNDWTLPYTVVFYTNVVLEGVKKYMPANDHEDWLDIQGQALFLRAYAFYHLAQVFAPPYDATGASTEPGIPLRLNSDLNEKTQRATLEETYRQITEDLITAAHLLKSNTSYKTRPCKTAAYAMLARTYLSMEDYAHARIYADSALQMQPELMDYNALDSTAYNPVARFNEEVIFHTSLFPTAMLLPEMYRVDTLLYKEYTGDDLRRAMFFKAGETTDGHFFYGSYDGSIIQFNGLATDEMYLIRAECYARADDPYKAMDDLNTLLAKRWKTGTFVQAEAGDANQALEQILQERRKELVFRGLRWTDLRRLNKDPRFAVTLKRELNGKEYTLPPGDKRYVFPIPQQVISKTGIPQNER